MNREELAENSELGATLFEAAAATALIALVALAGVYSYGNEVGKFFCEITHNRSDNPVERKGLGFSLGATGGSYQWDSAARRCVVTSGFDDGDGDNDVF